MNKTVAKTLITGFVCLAFCGTLMAAPGRGNGEREPQRATAHQNAPGHDGSRRNRAPANRCTPAHHRAPVAHHAPPPPRCEPPPPPLPVRHCEGAGWVTLSAAIIGGIVGACL